MPAGGSVIFLHGASSSGKSTIARALQASIDRPFLHYSIDHLRDAGVWPWDRLSRGDFAWPEFRDQFFAGYHRSLAGFVTAGNDVIVEHILDTKGWLTQLQALLSDRDVFFVGVRCDLDELKRREARRNNRPAGSAEADYHTVHSGLQYDFEVDTSNSDNVIPLVEMLIAAWRNRSHPGVFHRLHSAPDLRS